MMKFKIIFIVLVAAAIIPGRFYLSGILESGSAYAQVKQIDEQAGKVRGRGQNIAL